MCVARGGVVMMVLVSHDAHGLKSPNNRIAIAHGDGTSGWYLHLRKDGSLVRVGEHVEQGQRIAKSGHVGRSLAPHLHFAVRDDAQRVTLPTSFADVSKHAGVPWMGFHCNSGNKQR